MITIGTNKHHRLKLTWIDIAGDSTTVSTDDFNKMKCCEIIRTFASYQVKDDIGYGDRNVYPIEVFTDDSQKRIRKAWKLMSKKK